MRTLDASQVALDGLVEPLVVRCARIWDEPGLEDRASIEIGPRLWRSLGRCYPQRGLVRIAPLVLRLPETLQEEVVVHELAHLVAHARRDRDEPPHGSTWRSLMLALQFQPRARLRLEIEVMPPEPLRRRAAPFYEHRCPVCQAVRFARRRMTLWRCARCVSAGLDGRLSISPRTAGA